VGFNPPLVLVITGPPASGKTTLGVQLAERLGLAFLSKDLFKETLFDELGWSDRAWSRRLAGASLALMFRIAGVLVDTGVSVAVESNFYPEWDTSRLHDLAAHHRCQFVQVVCSASGPILVARYTERNASGNRHPGHSESEDLPDVLRQLLTQPERWEAMDVDGPVFRVKTDLELSPDVGALANAIRIALTSQT
jgi:predicted kinase